MDTISKKQRIMTILLKGLATHTATSLAKEFKMSRWGIWKILKKLEREELIVIKPIGSGKTSTSMIRLNWDNVLVEKILAMSLTQEALKRKRWLHNFACLEQEVDFLILYGSVLYSKEANDIDIVGIANEKKLSKIDDIVFKTQQTQTKKIHSINFTKKEFKRELNKPNKAFIDAVRNGVILFGQENFIEFMKEFGK